jgi:predicted metal-binding membrane protein
VCLTRCRGPVMFVMENFRPGLAGAFRLGAVHGAWCVGCCWALMAALFALGVMSIAWMAFVAGLIALEKILPWRRVATYGTAAILLVLAVLLLAAPDAIPGLTVPGDDGGMKPSMMM